MNGKICLLQLNQWCLWWFKVSITEYRLERSNQNSNFEENDEAFDSPIGMQFSLTSDFLFDSDPYHVNCIRFHPFISSLSGRYKYSALFFSFVLWRLWAGILALSAETSAKSEWCLTGPLSFPGSCLRTSNPRPHISAMRFLWWSGLLGSINQVLNGRPCSMLFIWWLSLCCYEARRVVVT